MDEVIPPHKQTDLAGEGFLTLACATLNRWSSDCNLKDIHILQVYLSVKTQPTGLPVAL